ncbi:DUF2190 family protein [Clostridium butyricum]|uniref:DUF2190 family protein n=1 Tax=Clostridium butyricum TaxID=1492 RepID=UPI003D3506EA
MKAIYWQRGESIDYKNASSSKIEALSVVSLVTRIGVAGTDINPSDTGSVHVEGVYKMKKAAEEIALGANVYFDVNNDCITTTSASNIPAGYAVEASASADGYVQVKLLG